MYESRVVNMNTGIDQCAKSYNRSTMVIYDSRVALTRKWPILNV